MPDNFNKVPGLLSVWGGTDGVSVAAGLVGERMVANVGFVSRIPMVNDVQLNVVSLTLAPGIWLVSGSVAIYEPVAANVTYEAGSLSIISETITNPASGWYNNHQTPFVPAVPSYQAGACRSRVIVISANETWYLVAHARFSAGAVAAFGTIEAIRLASA